MLGQTDLLNIVVKKGAGACIGLATVVAAVTGAAAISTAGGQPTLDTGSTSALVTRHETAVQATAPRFVSGYSFHCSQEMAAEDVTGAEVDWVVQNYYLSATYDEEQATWRYPGPTLIVVLNNNGFCVTVFRP